MAVQSVQPLSVDTCLHVREEKNLGFADFGERSTGTSSEFGCSHQRKCPDQRHAMV